MDVDQRKYLIERIKQEYNNTIAPLKGPAKNNGPRYELYTPEEMEEMLRRGDFTKVIKVEPNHYGSDNFLITYFKAKSEIVLPDYSAILSEITTEKNKVLDQIMLGDIPNATEILSKFLNFLSTEKVKFNGN